MANRYWVGGAGTWNTTNAANWSDTSGGTGGFSVPTLADDVFFDVASGLGTVIISTTNGAKSLNCTGYTGTFNHQVNLSVAGSVTLATGMTYGGSGGFTFTATGTFISAGKLIDRITINAPGGTATLGGALTLTGGGFVSLSAGTFDTAGYALSGVYISTSGTSARAFSFGASTISLSGSAGSSITAINFSSQTNLTFNAGTSQINLTAQAVTITCAVSFYNVAFTSTTVSLGAQNITGANSFNNLSFAGSSPTTGTNIVTFSANQTIAGTLTISPGPRRAVRTYFQSDIYGTQRTLSIAALDASSDNCDFSDIVVTGTASPITMASCGDCGNNSGITFTTPKTVYYALTTAGNWDANVWAATDGGAADQTQYPLPQDTAVFPSGFPNSGVTVTIPSTVINCSGIDASARTTNTITIALPTNTRTFVGVYAQGSFTGASGVTITIASTTFPLIFRGGSAVTFTPNGTTLPAKFGAQCVGGGFFLGQNVTAASSEFALGGGVLNLNGFTLSVDTIIGIQSTARSIAFGTSSITLSGSNKTIFSLSNAAFTYTGTFLINLSYTGSTGTRNISASGFSVTNPVDFSVGGSSGFVLASGATDTVNIGGVPLNNLNLTGFSGSFAVGFFGLSIYGNLNLGTTATLVSNTYTLKFSATTGTQTITSNGRTFNSPVDFFGDGVKQLQDAFTINSARLTSLAGGLLDLNGYTLSTGQFNSSSANVRSIAFGTGNITLTGTGTVWDTTTLTNFSRTGTPTINVSNNSATATTVTTGSASEAQALDFNYTTGTYTLTDSSARYRNLNLTGFAGTFANNARTYYGGFNAGSTATLTAGANAQTFAATSGTWGITPNGRTCDFPFTFNGAGGTWQLQGALTCGAARTTTLTAGTLDLNGFTYTTGLFSITGTAVRAIAFGTGNITLNGTGTVWNGTTLTNFSDTGTPTVNVSNNSATATTVITGTATEAQAIDFNYTTGTYALTDTSAVYRSVNLTGFAGTYANNARTYYGGFNAGSTATMTAGANAQTFAATSGTWPITRNGRTLDFPFTFNGIGGTWQLQDNLTTGSSRAFTLTNGTLDINGQTTNVGIFTLPASTSRAIANGTLTCASVTHTAGAFAVGSGYNIDSTGTYTFTAGTLTINDGVAMPVGAFSSSNSNVRTIAFGTGQISLTGNSRIVWDTLTATNFAFTGTFKVVATYAGATGTRTFVVGGTEATAQSVSTAGSSGFILDTTSTDSKALQGSFNNFDLTGVNGTFQNMLRTIFGDFNAGSTVTFLAGGNSTTFASTSGTKTITTNGRTLDFPLVFDGVGGTWQLQGALTMGTTRAFTLTSGTFDANNYNVTAGTVASSNSNVRTLALGSGTWTVAGNAWTFTTSTNATITGTATISMTSASAKSFQGGGLTWPTLNQGGAGALTITGNNTFANITSTRTATGACTITLPASGTQTLTNFTASGTSATNLLTLNSSTAGTQTNLVLNNDASLSFTSLRDNSVSGGYTYNARYINGNVNVSNNTGWDFGPIPGSFFAFF